MTNKLLERLKAKLWCLVEQEPEIYGELYQLANSVKWLELSEEVREAVDGLRKELTNTEITDKMDFKFYVLKLYNNLAEKAQNLLNTLEAMDNPNIPEKGDCGITEEQLSSLKATTHVKIVAINYGDGEPAKLLLEYENGLKGYATLDWLAENFTISRKLNPPIISCGYEMPENHGKEYIGLDLAQDNADATAYSFWSAKKQQPESI